jgi:methylthioribulose 1-phosphate dehydratase / enolase-phosphatase E1
MSPAKKQKLGKEFPTAIVLDIEGTVAPISFVTDVLFPYARAHLKSHLEATYETSETQADIQLLRDQVHSFLSAFRALKELHAS